MCQFFICIVFLIWDWDIKTEICGEAKVPSNLAESYGCRVYSFPCVNKLFFPLNWKSTRKVERPLKINSASISLFLFLQGKINILMPFPVLCLVCLTVFWLLLCLALDASEKGRGGLWMGQSVLHLVVFCLPLIMNHWFNLETGGFRAFLKSFQNLSEMPFNLCFDVCFRV